MGVYNGYRTYENELRSLYALPNNRLPFPALYNMEKNAPAMFNVAAASVPYTNTPMKASSTFVRHINFLPTSKTAFVRIGNGQYVYPMTPKQLGNWLCSNSLGRFYNNYIKY